MDLQRPRRRRSFDAGCLCRQRDAEFTFTRTTAFRSITAKGAYASTTIALKPAAESGDYQLTIGPVQGRFAGQPKQCRYVVQVHGLLKPQGVAANAAPLAEIQPERVRSRLEMECDEANDFDPPSRGHFERVSELSSRCKALGAFAEQSCFKKRSSVSKFESPSG